VSDYMHSADKADDNTREELSPYEDQTREYRAMRGKRTGGNRVLFLLFVPNDGTHDRFISMSALKLFDPSKDGREIILEFSDMTIQLRGRNLYPVAAGIGAGWVAALEAFDPDRRDRPRGDVPVIESVQFYRRPEAEPSAKGEGLHLVKRN
jgi:hypothetical protein